MPQGFDFRLTKPEKKPTSLDYVESQELLARSKEVINNGAYKFEDAPRKLILNKNASNLASQLSLLAGVIDIEEPKHATDRKEFSKVSLIHEKPKLSIDKPKSIIY